MGFKPTYNYTSLGVLIGTVGASGGVIAGNATIGPIGFTPLPGRISADAFTAADVGRLITIMGAGVGGTLLITRVQSYIDSQHVTVQTAPSTSIADGIQAVTVFRPIRAKLDSITFEENLTDAVEGGFISQQLAGEYPPAAGQPFLFTSTDPALADAYGTFWGGELDSVDTNWAGFLNGTQKVTESTIKCVSYKAVLQRRVMLGKQYSSTTKAAVVQDICQQATADYIDYTVAGDTAVSLLTVDDYTYLDQGLDALHNLASSGPTKHFWYIDHWRKVHSITESTTPAPWSVSDTGASDGNVLVTVSRTTTREKLANQVYAKASKALGDLQTTTFTNSFNGTPLPTPRRALTLPIKAGITPKITVNSVAKKVWVSPIDPRNDTSSTVTIPSGYDWAWPEDSDYLFCDSGRPGIPSGGTGVVTFYPAGTAISHDLNSTSVSERSAVQGGSGLHEAVESVDAPMSKAELDTWVSGHVEAFGLMPESVNVISTRPGLRRGMGLTVHLTEIGATVNYVVESVSLAVVQGWPQWTVKASIGAFIGDWTSALLRAFGADTAIGGGVGFLSTGSVLSAQFIGDNAQKTIPYSAKILVNGGTSPYTFALGSSSSPLPGGLTLNTSTGIISGTPTATGTFPFTIAVLDAAGQSTSCAASIIIVDPPSSGENIGTATSVTVVEDLPDYQDVNGAVHKVLTITGNVTATTFNVRTRIFIDFDDGRGAINMGDYWATGASTAWTLGAKRQTTGQVLPPPDSLYTPVDPTKIHWKVYIECNATTETPTLAAKEVDIDVTPASVVPTGDVTNFTFVNNDLGSAIDYISDNSTQYWIPHEIDASLPDADTTPYLKNLFLTVQAGYMVSCVATVTGGSNVALTSGTIASSDDGKLVFLNNKPFRLTYVDSTHFTLAAAVYGGATTTTNGTGITCEVFRNAPASTFFGDAGKDDNLAFHQGYWGRKFADLDGPVSGSPSTARYHGEIVSWTIIPDKYEDYTDNPYLYHYFFGFSISRLADNEAGGDAGAITFHPNWVTGKAYGVLRASMQSYPLDGRYMGRSKSFTDTSIFGGNGNRQRANLGYTTYLDASGQIAVKNLRSLTSLPTLPSADYEAGSVVRLSTNGKLYRTDGFSWALSTDPADLSAGAIASGVTLNASQVNAGTFNGCSLNLNFGGITTTINNQFDSVVGTNLGIKTSHNTTGAFSFAYPGTVGAYSNGSGSTRAGIGAGSFAFADILYGFLGLGVSIRATSGGGSISIDGNQVLKGRLAGPGTTSDTTDVAIRFNALLLVLRTHGLIS